MAFITALPLRLSRRPARVLLGGLLFVFFILTLTRRRTAPAPAPPSVHYKANTKSFFPPLKHKAGLDPDFCENFPTKQLDDIQVVLKTGAADGPKLKAHLATITSCIPNLLIVSDHEQKIGQYNVIDVLAELPLSYAEGNNDFKTYTNNKKAQAEGDTVNYSQAGWRLDRFKFLPMVDKAYAVNPKAKWYVFLESDVYFFWDTLFRLLDQFDPTEPHYLGAPSPGSDDRWFAYGGAGFVTSQGLMKKLYVPKTEAGATASPETKLAVKYEKMVKEDCCGDAVLAYAIQNTTGVKMESLYPTFAGEELKDVSIDKDRWCVPLLSLHRVAPENMESLWKWERTRTYNQKPFVYSSLLAYTHSFLREGASKDWWDNLSVAPVPNDRPAHKNPGSCGSECEKDRNCLQWSHSQTVCRWANYIKLGNAVDSENGGQGMMSSGWELKKMAELGFKVDEESDINDTCEEATWVKATIR
ncbi:hypothetical protein DPSP01_000817 [Paraphaeosphaeria sporulosa]|uniref:N-acetylgalactosaminide beta-1,3-galactosyltransferase n=1 Tax=Paraphaeosphaeria sporulosa TaxID=1460663 RepID=A0A177CRE9_9PLEO|nr:uncharacterized protein CC84DRAFT_1137139 [Paraphaeosphaeria sporulosa]OAG09460.1 hypothetical protein CC84DRAFT_1137139 [Paraphaeosphaeria sporulosa]